MSYFIKTVYPRGYGSQPDDLHSPLAFESAQENMCDKLAYSTAFFLYETAGDKDNKGHQTIYARGSSLSPFCTKIETYRTRNGKDFSVGLDVELDKVVNPKHGIPKVEIDKIKPIRQARGGLIEITKEEFDKLSIMLGK